jgi:hypothetical protein
MWQLVALYLPPTKLDYVRLSREAQCLYQTYDSRCWNIVVFPVWRGVLINVADPDFEADGTDGVTECHAGLSVPRGGVRGCC